jgi:hypothetical protein
MLLIEYASRSFLWKWPVASYTVTDQNASTGTGSGIVSRCTVVPSLRAAVTFR